MKKSEIKVGGHYTAKVSGKLVTVRVDSVDVREGTRFRRGGTWFCCTNLATGKKVVRSAAAFRREVKQDLTKVKAIEGGTIAEKVEAEQRPDPTAPAASTTPAARNAGPSTATSTSPLAAALKALPVDDSPHLIVEARAGTGKTTTLIAALQVLMGQQPTTVKILPDGKRENVPITPSPQQQAVWDAVTLSKSKARSVCFVAFNRSIAEELKSRVPAGCDAMTMHSMGFRAVTRMFGRLEVNSYVVQDHVASLLGKDIRWVRQNKLTTLKATEELVGLCKMNLTLETDIDRDTQYSDLYERLSRLASHYGVELNGSQQEVFGLVPRVLELCKAPQGRIDYDDMIWLPVVLGLPLAQYDLLMVDEAQDLNRCQQALAKRAGKRLVLCGDSKQAIYGFAGADAESMPRMARELEVDVCPTCRSKGWIGYGDGTKDCPTCKSDGVIGRGCTTLPLTVTRRCGKAIVREANRIVSDFEAHEGNPEGRIGRASYTGPKDAPMNGKETEGHGITGDWSTAANYAGFCADGDMVLCRVNAPLVSQCFRFLKAGRKANIQGRDIGAGLVSTVKKMEATSVVDLIARLDANYHREQAKELAKQNPDETRLIALQDRHDCLVCFTEGADTVEDVVRKIEQVFTDDKTCPGIRLSSIHKAKGLEARRVFFLMPKGAECPHPMAKSAWQREQEMNLCYVAITRAIEELVYVS